MLVLAIKNPNILGEALREEFFKEKDGKFGCYNNFELADDVIPLPNRKVYWDNSNLPEDLLEDWTCAKKLIHGVEVFM